MKPSMNKKHLKQLMKNGNAMQDATPKVAGGFGSLPPTDPMRDCKVTKGHTGCIACMPTQEYSCRDGCTTKWN
ncbi:MULTISPECIES: hypothetical protein [Pseudoalteromonas]|uniref:Uncharacterized protein n=1 Tax=Pseudoalteromonas luteoviolacea (strain 2ta16) TaxID=1353533 RepID=V4HI63_PSEL2|nr:MULTISPECIES: hypothetical protein [Pseudoalteromonas]ESP90470.1 hypothetical protein PL2TA16_01573 [Pseudoalteromonas luteoviolacea 2ta16]KZN41962.1 hypothetical protein N483_14925 [Pseudoalteromonas luteoviolacea NCIMB 1944]MCG7549822.1 hypothetical protein [Pseudoalteromonas sp. Of7M-16]